MSGLYAINKDPARIGARRKVVGFLGRCASCGGDGESGGGPWRTESRKFLLAPIPFAPMDPHPYCSIGSSLTTVILQAHLVKPGIRN